MDISRVLHIGDLMEVEIETNQFAATKVDNVEGNLITVDYLTSKGKPIHLKEMDIYPMLKKSAQGLFFFNARYEGRFRTEANRHYMRFLAITEPLKNQRRQSFRVPLRLDVEMLYVHNIVLETTIAATQKYGPRKVDLQKEWLKTYAADISEEGMLIYADSPPSIGGHVMVRFALEGEDIFTNAVVRRHAYAKSADPRPNMVGVQFIELDEKYMRLIRKFVMEYQIQERIRLGGPEERE